MEIIHSLYYIIHKILLYKKNTLYVFIIKFNHLIYVHVFLFHSNLNVYHI